MYHQIIFPLDLFSTKVVVSVEPFPDNSSNPFLLKPLVTADHTSYNRANNNNTSPVGTVLRP